MIPYRGIRRQLDQQRKMVARLSKAAKKDKEKADEINKKVSSVSESLKIERSVNHFSERISKIMKERRGA